MKTSLQSDSRHEITGDSTAGPESVGVTSSGKIKVSLGKVIILQTFMVQNDQPDAQNTTSQSLLGRKGLSEFPAVEIGNPNKYASSALRPSAPNHLSRDNVMPGKGGQPVGVVVGSTTTTCT